MENQWICGIDKQQDQHGHTGVDDGEPVDLCRKQSAGVLSCKSSSRIVARKPVRSSTVTQELMIENQWICGATCGARGVSHKILLRMVDLKEIWSKSSTVTQELMMEKHWICRGKGKEHSRRSTVMRLSWCDGD